MLLICLHGYGESAQSFAALAGELQNEYRVIAVNLPFHGDTRWTEGYDFSQDDLLFIADKISGGLNFILLGFSMGGRVALQLYQLQPQRVVELILLAPDGLKLNGWYWLATQTNAGNRLFKYCMEKPALFFKAANWLKKLRRIPAGIYNYVMQFLQQPGLRRDLYVTWTTFRKIKPDTRLVSRAILQYQTPVQLIYGQHDTIIPRAAGDKFARACGNHCKLWILPCGHRLLQAKNIPAIVSVITHTKAGQS